MKTYEDFLKKVSEGVEYANSIGGIESYLRGVRSPIQFRLKTTEFQFQTATWVNDNICPEDFKQLVANMPGREIEVKLRLAALIDEGKKYEDSSLAQCTDRREQRIKRFATT